VYADEYAISARQVNPRAHGPRRAAPPSAVYVIRRPDGEEKCRTSVETAQQGPPLGTRGLAPRKRHRKRELAHLSG